MSHVRQQGTVLTRHDRCPHKSGAQSAKGPLPSTTPCSLPTLPMLLQAEAASQAASGLGWWQAFAHIYGTCIQTMPSITT